jgi:hypothetical protein
MTDYKAIDKVFDKRFPDGVIKEYDKKTDTWEIDVTDKIKSFIHSQIDQAIAKHNQQVIEIVKNMRVVDSSGRGDLIDKDDVIKALKEAQELVESTN